MMARKQYSDEDALKIFRQTEVHLHGGLDVVSACLKAGVGTRARYSSTSTAITDSPVLSNWW